MITIPRTVGPDATFDPADTLRVHRGTPALGQEPKSVTSIDIADPQGRVETNLSMDEVLILIGTTPHLIKLTAPDGSPVWVNAGKISDLQQTDSWDRVNQVAHSQFILNKNPQLPQQVQETIDAIRSLAQTSGNPIP